MAIFLSLHKKSFGFTLIELIISVTVIAIVSVITVASFAEYQSNQTLEVAMQEVVTHLQTAKSKALTQVKTIECEDIDSGVKLPLNGYQVVVIPENSYRIEIVCGGLEFPLSRYDKKLPSNTKFNAGGTIFFPVLIGGSNALSLGTVVEIQHTRTNKKATITVYPDGRIVSKKL